MADNVHPDLIKELVDHHYLQHLTCRGDQEADRGVLAREMGVDHGAVHDHRFCRRHLGLPIHGCRQSAKQVGRC